MRGDRRLLQFEQPLQPPIRLRRSGASSGCNRTASRLLQFSCSLLKVFVDGTPDEFRDRSACFVGQLLQLLNLLLFEEEGCPLHGHIVPHRHTYVHRTKVLKQRCARTVRLEQSQTTAISLS
jgi:hypothetical protein